MQLHQSGRICGHDLRRAPCKVGTQTDTKRTLRHVRPVFYGINTGKILGNASSVGKICKLAWVLSRVMPTCGKSFVPFGGVKKISSREPPSGRPKRSSLHWGYVIACMQLHQSGRICGHGLRRAPCKVGTQTDTKRTLCHVRPVFYGINTGKILGNASSVGKICKLAWVLSRVMPTCGKSFVLFGGVKKIIYQSMYFR